MAPLMMFSGLQILFLSFIIFIISFQECGFLKLEADNLRAKKAL